MGIFYEQVKIVNRAPIALTVTFDGQRLRLEPGENAVPELVIPYAMNQNPIMGSADPYNPHISGARYLIGVVGDDRYPCTPLTKDEWESHLNRPCRDDETIWFQDRYGSDPKAKQVVMGKGRKSTASSRHDAGGNSGGLATFERRE